MNESHMNVDFRNAVGDDFRAAVLNRRRAWTDEMDEDEPRRPVTRSQTRIEQRAEPPPPPAPIKKVVFAAPPPPPPPPPTPIRRANDDDDNDEEEEEEDEEQEEPELPEPPPPLGTAVPATNPPNTAQAVVPPPLAPEMQLPAPLQPAPVANPLTEARKMCMATLGVDLPEEHPRYKALRDAWTAVGGWSGGANMLGNEQPGLTAEQMAEIYEKEGTIYDERMQDWVERVGPWLIDQNSTMGDMAEFVYIMQCGYAMNDMPSFSHAGAIYDKAGSDAALVNINRLGFSTLDGQASIGLTPEGENQRAYISGFYPSPMVQKLAYHLRNMGYTVATKGRVWEGKDAQDPWISDSIHGLPDRYATKKTAQDAASVFLPPTRDDSEVDCPLVRKFCNEMAYTVVIGGWGVTTLWDDMVKALAQTASEFDVTPRIPPEKQRHYQALPSPPATQPIAEAAVVAAATQEPEVKVEVKEEAKAEVKKEPEPAPAPAPAPTSSSSPPPAAVPTVADSLRHFIDDMILMPDWIFEQRQPTAQEDEQRNIAMASLSSAWQAGLTREYGEPEFSRLLALEAEHVMSHVRKIDWDNSPVMFYCVMRKVEIDRNIIRHVRVAGMDALDKEIFNVARVEAARMLKNIEAVRRQIILSRQPAYTPPSSVYHKAKPGESFENRGESGDGPGLHGRPVRFSSSSPPGGPPPPTTPPGGGRPVVFSGASNPPPQASPQASPQRPQNFGERMAALRAGEKAQAMQKARDYWARHPNAEKPDKRKTAKLVYKAAKYTPKKNDFPGVDTRAVGVREGVVRRARRT